MVRIILAAATVILYLLVTWPVLVVTWLAKKSNPHAGDMLCLRMVQGVFKLILLVGGVKATIIGEENVPGDQAVLYIGNHRSFFDVILTYSRCPGLTGYIAKKEMEHIPIFSSWMRALHCLFLDRRDIRAGMKTILTAIEDIRQGISICIFPEGTRNKGGDETKLLPFHEGSFKIAEKTNCPIIPMSLNHTSEIFEDHLPRIRRTHVTLEYGEPILPADLDKETRKKLGLYVQDIMQKTITKNH